jgi:hypothetical protein
LDSALKVENPTTDEINLMETSKRGSEVGRKLLTEV